MTTGLNDGAGAGRIPGLAGHSRQPTQASREDAQAPARLGSWQFDPAAGEGFWSRERFLLLGRDRALGRPSPPEFFALFHPDDRTALRVERRAGEGAP